MRAWRAGVVAACFALSAGQASSLASERPRRFALVVAQNRGMGADKPLQYAHLDALNMAEVLRTAGGVADRDMVVLTAASPALVRKSMTELERRIRDELAGAPGQLIVYVSSHASRHRLRLDGAEFEMAQLRTFLQRVQVDLGVLIIDTCEAGSITDVSSPSVRIKGAEPLRDSMPNVFIRRPAVSGRVIITSSGADEYSHESDALRGSVFTHHLIAGLRGVADVSRDGNVSLAEAYEYAYVRTVGEAAQHPNWEVLLRGQGDPVLTTPRLSQGILRIEVPESGEWILRSVDGRGILAEFEKGPGDIALAVPPGEYMLRVGRAPGQHFEGRVLVTKGQRAHVTRTDLSEWQRQTLVAKGEELPFEPWSVFASGSARAPVSNRLDWLWGAIAGLRYDIPWRAQWTGRLTMGVGVHRGPGEGDLQHTEGEVYLGAGIGWRGLRPFELTLGLEAGVALASQSQGQSDTVDSGFASHARARLGIDVRVTSWLSAGVSVGPGVVVFSTPDGLQPVFQLPITSGAAVVF